MSTATSASTSSGTTLRASSDYPDSSSSSIPAELDDRKSRQYMEVDFPMSQDADYRFGDHLYKSSESPKNSRTLRNSPPQQPRTISSSSSNFRLEGLPVQPPSPSLRAGRKRASTMYDEHVPSLPVHERYKNLEPKTFSPVPRNSSLITGIIDNAEVDAGIGRGNSHIISPGRQTRQRNNSDAAEMKYKIQPLGDFASSRQTPNGNRRSGVWDELESVKERLQRLKFNGLSEGPGVASRATSSAGSSRLYRQTSFSSPEHEPPEFPSPQKSLSPLQNSPVIQPRTTHSSLSNYNSTTFQRSTTPSQAERHLRDVLERARPKLRSDINVVLLDRTAQDLLAVYNTNCDAQQLDALDRACISLASFLLQIVDSATNSSARPETPPLGISHFSPIAHQSFSNGSRFKARPYLGSPQSTGGLPRAASAVPFLGGRSEHEYDNDLISREKPVFSGLKRTTSLRSAVAALSSSVDDYSTPSSKSSKDFLFSSGVRSLPGNMAQPSVRRYGNARRTHSTLYDTSGSTPGGGGSSHSGLTSEGIRRKRHSLTFI